MRTSTVVALVLAAAALAAFAVPASAKDGKRKHRADRRARILEKFDANGDGKLDKAERAAMREARRAHREKKGDREGRRHRRK